MAQDTPEVRELLAAEGFSEDILIYRTRDDVTNAVVQRKDGGHLVQVQLCRDVLLKRNVRDIIKTYMWDEHLQAEEDERIYMWSTLARALSFRPGVSAF